MAARSVQISLDEELLREIDRRPETKRDGRSAVIKRALRLYLDRKQRESIDESYARAYARSDKASKSQRPNEFDEMLAGQAWPDEES
jgi:metal-responsive CopG/Arc/MetJ family transcriptional regulator